MLVSETNPELREAGGQDGQLVVVQVQMLKVGQVPQVIWQTVQLVFTQIHLHQVGQVAELWLHERNSANEITWGLKYSQFVCERDNIGKV